MRCYLAELQHRLPIASLFLITPIFMNLFVSALPVEWNETIAAHRRDLRAAILDITAALVAEHGLLPVTMAQIAEATDIGWATLYKYF